MSISAAFKVQAVISRSDESFFLCAAGVEQITVREAVRRVIANDGSPFVFDKSFVLNRKIRNLALLGVMSSPPTITIAERTEKPRGTGDFLAGAQIIPRKILSSLSPHEYKKRNHDCQRNLLRVLLLFMLSSVTRDHKTRRPAASTERALAQAEAFMRFEIVLLLAARAQHAPKAEDRHAENDKPCG